MLLATFVSATLLAADGDSVVQQVDAAVAVERRRRQMAGILQTTTGGVRMIGGGALLGTAPNLDGGRARAGSVHLFAGGVSIGLGVFSLTHRGPMEQLQRSRSFQILRVAPNSEVSIAAVQRAWTDAARRARRLRLIAGTTSLLAGSALSVAASVRIWGLDDGWNLHTSTVLFTGMLYIGRGVINVIEKSPAERSIMENQRSRSWAITPTFGGLSLSGRF